MADQSTPATVSIVPDRATSFDNACLLKANRAMAAEEAVLDWLESQANITRLWIEILIARNGCLDMIETLARHARFLENALLVK